MKDISKKVLPKSEFQNEFMKSTFFPKYKLCHTTGQKSLHYLDHILGETMTS